MSDIEDHSTLTNVSPVLTDERLTEALTKWFQKTCTFTRWEYVSKTGKGDSFLSEVIRIKIHGKFQNGDEKYVQVILKNIPKNLSRRLTFRSDEFFKNEIIFYNIALTGLLNFQAKKSLKDPFEQYAKLFFSYSDGTNDVIILEDVSVYNFSPYPVRQEGIDYEHCKLTLKSQAQFHALSFAMKDQEPENFEKIRNSIFETYYHDRLRGWYSSFWARISGVAVDAVEKEFPDSIYLEKIKKFAVPETYDALIDAACNTVQNGVISHGDSWTNNFLYKYVNNKPVEAKMIDFQLTRCASPVLDISFVFFACTTKDLRDKHYDELIQYYYDVLSTQIRELGSDPDMIYPYSVFMEELKKYSFFGLAFSFESTPFIVLPPEETFDMEGMKGSEKLNISDVWRVGPFKTREGRLREVNNIVFCVDRGYI